MSHIKAQDPIKGMSQEVHWMSLIINHNCLKLTWQWRWTEWKTSAWRESTLHLCQSQPESGLLLLREAINLSENGVTQPQTKEHFGDVQQVLRQMTLISLVLMVNLKKWEFGSRPFYVVLKIFFIHCNLEWFLQSSYLPLIYVNVDVHFYFVEWLWIFTSNSKLHNNTLS